MSSPSVSTARSPLFGDPTPFSVSQYVREYVNYLHSRRFAAMRENLVALMICDRKIIAAGTFASAWVKRGLHCRGLGMYVSCCASFKADMPFLHC